jgi:membrane protease subunit HflK
MSERGGTLSTEERVRRSVGRTIGTVFLLLIVFGVLLSWSYFGWYTLDPGQHAIVFRFGKYATTEASDGLHFHLPPPIERHEIVNVSSIQKEEFGVQADTPEGGAAARHEASMQTSDNNIVNLGFVVQYQIKDAFQARYRVASLGPTLREAAQAATREVVGRTTIDGLISEQRGQVADEAMETLQDILDGYESGLAITGFQLQEVQPPSEVRDAFDDVLAASQDHSRLVNQAQGVANEVVPEARAQAAEVVAEAQGYRDAKVAEARGEAQRFLALVAEYQRAPQVTRRRLYLETMEEVLPGVEKVIIEPGTNLLPYLPLGRSAQDGAGEKP